MLLRNPCKNSKSYVNPFWGKSNGSKKKKRRKIPKIVVTLVALLAHATRSDQNVLNGGINPSRLKYVEE